jgi:hypothetical protein
MLGALLASWCLGQDTGGDWIRKNRSIPPPSFLSIFYMYSNTAKYHHSFHGFREIIADPYDKTSRVFGISRPSSGIEQYRQGTTQKYPFHSSYLSESHVLGPQVDVSNLGLGYTPWHLKWYHMPPHPIYPGRPSFWDGNIMSIWGVCRRMPQ